MGIVYLARDDRIGRSVAVKALHIDERLPDTDKEEIRERFEREARAAGVLSHASIVTIYDVGEQDGTPYIAMEYLEGATLSEATAEGPMSIPRAVSIIEQVLSALSYAHEHEVVHRDIKPDNVFVLPDGRVKVADFGIARLRSSSTMTRVGQVMGTPGYMSPEQVKGEPVGPASDIFSTGVLFYELLTGTAAFSSTSTTSIMYKIVHEEPRLIHLVNPGVPPNLEAVIARAMAKNPAARYRSASDMKSDIETGASPPAPARQVAYDGTVLRTTPVPQSPPAAAYPGAPAPGAKKRVGLAIGAAVAGAALLAAVAVALMLVKPWEKKVVLTITNPKDRKVVNPVTVVVDAENPSRIARLEITVDGEVRRTLESRPFEAQVDVGAGKHTIMVTAYAKDNSRLDSKSISVSAAAAMAEEQTPPDGGAPPGGNEGGGPPPETETPQNYFAGGAPETYHNAAYSYTINYPTGWRKTEEQRDYGYRVKWWSPDGHMYFLIDASPRGAGDETPYSSARGVAQAYEGKAGYRLISMDPPGGSRCIWEFAITCIEDDFYKGQTVHKCDCFFNEGAYSYAVLLAGKPGNYQVNRESFIREILDTFRPGT